MKSSPRRGIEVFDFDENEEGQEHVIGKCKVKLKNPSSHDLALIPQNSLECAVPRTVLEARVVASLRVDAIDCDPAIDNVTSPEFPNEAEENGVGSSECFSDALPERALSPEKCVENSPERYSPANGSFLVQTQLSCDDSDSRSSDEHVDVTSDVDESMSKSASLSSPASSIPKDNDMLSDYAMDHHHCSGNMELDDMNAAIVLYPDYFIFRDKYCTGPKLTFSNSCIKITGSSSSQNQEEFDFEWGIEDLVKIECQWFQRVETVMIKLRLISKHEDEIDDDDSPLTSGVEELKIFVVESDWPQKQEDITSLHPSYLAVWDLLEDNDLIMGTDGDDSPRQGRYFPVFEESFEEFIYPKGDIDAVSISKRDVDLLQPETFINDTIIDFYISYLKNQIPPEERRRFHFFNSFFFRKLADLDKDPSSASDGQAAFQRVRKWTRKVDLFGKEFIFIPINFSLHWSLIVICHPGEVATSSDGETAKVPCILHLDSIKGNHAGLKHLIQSYLWEEWKERQKETSEEVSSRFLKLRFVSLELPQQENSFDCGLFLLHYLERFLADVPNDFSPFRISKSLNFLNSNWFLPSEASLKRTLIKRLISELLRDRGEEAPSSVSSDDEDQLLQSIETRVTSELHVARSNPGQSGQPNNSSTLQIDQGVELSLLAVSSMRNSQAIDESETVLRDLFNPETSDGALMGQCQPFEQKSSYYRLNAAISPMEEDPETGEQFMFQEAGTFNQHQMMGITSHSCNNLYQSKSFDTETALQADDRDIDYSSDPSICESDDSSVVAITESFPAEQSSPIRKEAIDEKRSPVTPATGEASQNHDTMKSGDTIGVPILSLEDAKFVLSQDSIVADSGMAGNCVNDSSSPADNGPSLCLDVDGLLPNPTGEDNNVGSGEDVQMEVNGLVGRVSSKQPQADGGIGLDAHFTDDGLAGLGDLSVDGGLVGPESPSQHPAKRARLSPSVEDEANVSGSPA